MNVFPTIVRNTLNKIWARGKYRVLFLICTALSIFFALYSRGGYSITLGGFALNLTNGSYTMLELLNTVFFPLLSFMLCADYFSHELSDSTIKAELLRPVGRGVLYFGKLGGMFCYCAQIMLANIVVGTVIGLFTGALGNIAYFLLASVMSLLVLVSFLALSAFVSVLLKHPSFVMFVLILLYLAIMFIGSAFAGIGAVLFTSYLNWYKMVMGSVIPWHNLIVTFGLLLSTSVLLGSLGEMLFERRDVG